MRLRFTPCLTLLVLWLLASSLFGTTFKPMSVEELASHSSHVVAGQFIHLESHWNAAGTTIYTQGLFRVDEKISGDLDESQIMVYLPGGTVGDTSVVVVEGPELAVHRPVVLMLRSVDAERHVNAVPYPTFQLTSLTQAVFDLQPEPTSGEMLAVPQVVGTVTLDSAGDTRVSEGGRPAFDFEVLKEHLRQ